MSIDIQGAIVRHDRIAFQLSGGADSVAALFVMQPWWDLLTVYYVDAGDPFPEITRVIEEVSHYVPIVRLQGNVHAYRASAGLASDVVPFDNTAVGRGLSGRTLPIVTMMECCGANLMQPLHEAMLRDKMTLLVRGTRAEEFKGGLPLRSGWSDGQVELLHPIEDWSKREVLRYLIENGRPCPPFYEEGMRSAPECMCCTAHWSEGRMAYLRRHHPAEAVVYEKNLRAIRGEVLHQMAYSLEELRNG